MRYAALVFLIGLHAACSGFEATVDGSADLARGDQAPDVVQRVDRGGDAADALIGDTSPDFGPRACDAQIAYREIDGVASEDCTGCACADWLIYGCYEASALYDEPYSRGFVDVTWQVGMDNLRFAVISTGELIPIGFTPEKEFRDLELTVHRLALATGELVDLELKVGVDRVNGGEVIERWDLHGRVIGECP